MNIIVTNNMIDYSGFMKLKTLKEVEVVTGNIDFLIYHKSNETREDKVELLTKLKNRVSTMVYIRGSDAIEKAVQMIVVGSGGKYFDDEFFLESSEELSSLINSLDEVTAIAELGGVNVLSDFFNRYLKNGSSGFNSEYLSIVKSAVSNMITEYKQKDLEVLQLSETATEIFSNSASILSKVESERENLKAMVASLQSAKKHSYSNSNSSTLPNLLFFPRVDYLKEKCIIRIKEMGNCSYLTSFILGFKLFLKNIKYVRPKLIFLYPTGEMYEEMYQEYSWVTQSSYKTMGVYYNDIVFTNFPNREVMYRLLDDSDYDIFIVVDRLKSDKTHLLNSKGGAVKYAVSGVNCMEKFGLKATSCFSFRGIGGVLFSIPQFTDYPVEVEQRERYYLRCCNKEYESLYKLSKLK